MLDSRLGLKTGSVPNQLFESSAIPYRNEEGSCTSSLGKCHSDVEPLIMVMVESPPSDVYNYLAYGFGLVFCSVHEVLVSLSTLRWVGVGGHPLKHTYSALENAKYLDTSKAGGQ